MIKMISEKIQLMLLIKDKLVIDLSLNEQNIFDNVVGCLSKYPYQARKMINECFSELISCEQGSVGQKLLELKFKNNDDTANILREDDNIYEIIKREEKSGCAHIYSNNEEYNITKSRYKFLQLMNIEHIIYIINLEGEWIPLSNEYVKLHELSLISPYADIKEGATFAATLLLTGALMPYYSSC